MMEEGSTMKRGIGIVLTMALLAGLLCVGIGCTETGWACPSARR